MRLRFSKTEMVNWMVEVKQCSLHTQQLTEAHMETQRHMQLSLCKHISSSFICR
jgi:hypothetical protein